MISAKSLKIFNMLPACLVYISELRNKETDDFFDRVIVVDGMKKHTCLSKVIGMQHTPF